MASNILEWTTETSSYLYGPYIYRGGTYYSSGYLMSGRGSAKTSDNNDSIGFRQILYVNV